MVFDLLYCGADVLCAEAGTCPWQNLNSGFNKTSVLTTFFRTSICLCNKKNSFLSHTF